MIPRITVRVAVLLLLLILFTIPFVFLGFLTRERRGYRDEAVADIARSSAESQRVVGPILVVPYKVRVRDSEKDAKTGAVTLTEHLEDEQLVLLPERLDASAPLALETRYRGIYEVPLYRNALAMTGRFVIPANAAPARGAIESWGAAQLLVGVSDPRGMREAPRVTWDGASAPTQPGTARAWLGAGFHAELGAIVPGGAPREIPFRIDLPLLGTQAFHLVPVGKVTQVSMRSGWANPSFTGRFLPDARQVRANGFDATWTLSRFATGIEDLVRGAAAGGDADGAARNALASAELGVDFVDPVDAYRLTDRALKYGWLFVLITFTAFFVFEVLGNFAVHPIQYMLVGSALVIFFLLLLSLSEHMAYLAAYVTASAACVALLGAYVAAVLRGWKPAVGFAAGLAALYALLYVVMNSQDYALLLGSALLFAVLTTVMMSTRRVNWHALGEKAPA